MAADFPRSVDEIYDDYMKRRSGILRALTDDVEDFFQACDPTKDNLCLYGLRDGNWSVDLPADEVPPELPEPCLGINFARDGMQRRDWLSLVAVHSDAWLLSVAFFYGVKLDATARARLFKLINQQSTLFETLGSKARPSKPQAGGAQPPPWQAQQQPNLAKKKKLEVLPHDAPPPRAGIMGFNAGSQNRPTESAHPSGKPLHLDDITPALKGRHAELFWPDNKLWYLVEIQQINVKTKSAKITYASGEEEDLDLDEILREGHMCLF